MQKKKIIFFGTPEHASRVLESFINEKNIEVCAVVTNPDRPVGRNKILTPSAVKILAEKNSIPVLQPEKCDRDFAEKLQKFSADFFVVVAYGSIMPQEILDIPKNGAFNLHFSLLPKYRGATPIQSALENGEKESGISIFRLEAGIDNGDIFIQEKISLIEGEYKKNHLETWDEMVEIGKKKLVELCQNFQNFSGVPQDDSHSTHCGRFTKSDGEIFPLQNTAEEILRKYRGYFLWPGIFSFDSVGKRIKWTEIQEYTGEEIFSCSVGTLFLHEKKCLLQTQKGVLEVVKLQKEGKKECEAKNLVELPIFV